MQILNSDGENINNDTITNKDITIKYEETEGIQTQVIINRNEVNNTEVKLSDNGIYTVEAKYSNYDGQSEEKNVNITIDKSPPQISGVENEKIYAKSIIPNVSDKQLETVQLTLDGQVVKGYSLGSELTDEGQYELTATDKAGNVSKVKFYIMYNKDGYQIKDNNIMNIDSETTMKEFKETFTLLQDDYTIKHEDKELTEEDIISTGDILEDSNGKEFTLIVLGDISGDGKLTLTDVSIARKYLTEIEELNDIQKLAADANLNEEVSISDVSIMRKIILGIE